MEKLVDLSEKLVFGDSIFEALQDFLDRSKVGLNLEEIYEPGRYGLRFHYLEIGPLNLPQSSQMAVVKEAVWNISSLSIPSN